ncbi:HAD family phosphatase [uncultured Bacteroides sp.]|uniref:HAD family hydrolase n=1 Tax=uncultured Bacteroides sp. TaxID=162156 RepID=UPI002AAB0C28|nr:HAD family phosphatase [uncultured Bacteroides sp.]
MERGKIKNIIIDFGGVLIDLDRQRCIDNFKKIGFLNVDEFIDPYRQQGFFMDFEKGLTTASEFRNAVREQAGKLIVDKQIDAAWNSFLIGIPTFKLDLLLELRKNYVVYLLSNTNEIHWKWACKNSFSYKGFRVEDYFEKMFLSFELHKAKPEAEIFSTLIEETGILPEESFFIDDASANCLVAQSFGITTYTPKAGEDWSHLFK